MPPASLSTLEVISPGPTTAQKRTRRRRRWRLPWRKARPRARHSSTLDKIGVQFIQFRASLLSALPKPAHHIVHGNDTDRSAVLVHHAQTTQVVLVKHLEDFLVFRPGLHRDERFRFQLDHGPVRRRQQQPSQRDVAGKLSFGVDQKDSVKLLRVDILRPDPLHNFVPQGRLPDENKLGVDRKSTRLNSSHLVISYAVFCLKKKKKKKKRSYHKD